VIQIIASFSVFNISQGGVATHLRWGVIFIILIILLHSSNWVRWWKNCENRPIFSKDMDKSIVSPFLTHGVYMYKPSYSRFCLKCCCRDNQHCSS